MIINKTKAEQKKNLYIEKKKIDNLVLTMFVSLRVAKIFKI